MCKSLLVIFVVLLLVFGLVVFVVDFEDNMDIFNDNLKVVEKMDSVFELKVVLIKMCVVVLDV